MQMDTITVWYDGLAITVHKQAADELKLKAGQRLSSDAEFWRVIKSSASWGLALCEIELARQRADTNG